MGIVRNSINITGITSEDKLPRRIKGQIVEYSEVEHISIPEENPRIRTIHQISFKVDSKVSRTINSPTGKILILDGRKKIKIIYSHKSDSKKSTVLDIQLPFNTYIDLPDDAAEVEDINIYVLDAYFDLLESRKLYYHVLYWINVEYSKEKYDKFDTPFSETTEPEDTDSDVIDSEDTDSDDIENDDTENDADD